MYATECSIPVVRKAALFSCLTGLRISDILRLKWENIRSYADGGYYLDFICVKTKCQTQVPIGDDAYALIHPKTNRTYIFQGFKRTMTYGVMQSWLKECGIEKHITFHCLSHSKFFYLLNISELSILKNVTANDLETSYILFLSQLCNIQRTL